MAWFSSSGEPSQKDKNEEYSQKTNRDLGKDGLPTYQDSEDSAAQQDYLSRLTASQKRTAQRGNEGLSHHASGEADRLRRFLHFNMSVDYQQDYTASLNAADRSQYATLNTMLGDLASTAEIPASTEERALLAPYFWHVLHQACAILGIPVELVIAYVRRFFAYQGKFANYKGNIWHIPLRESIEAFAAKLLTDREIMIPKIFQEPEMRAQMFRCLDKKTKRYFTQLSGVEAATELGSFRRITSPDDPNYVGWRDFQHITCTLTAAGGKYLKNKGACIEESRSRSIAPLTAWVQRAKAGIDSMRKRAGTKTDSNDSCIGRFEGQRVMWKYSYHLPDMFAAEHQPNYTRG